MKHELMKLPFAHDALEPFMSAKTLSYHYDKHHAGYVSKLNSLIEDTALGSKTLLEIIMHTDGPIFNNAAQVYNHDFFWKSLSAQKSEPSKELESMILKEYESMSAFKEAFIKEALGLFGSGWVWLCLSEKGALQILATSNAHTPITEGFTPLLVCDVWEHAYYLDHQNSRANYLESWFELINWDFASQNFSNFSA